MTNGSPSVAGPVLHVTGLTKSYRAAGEDIAVLRGVTLTVAAGESVALTGESMPGARNCAATGLGWCFSNST